LTVSLSETEKNIMESRRRFVPCLESLEERAVPASVSDGLTASLVKGSAGNVLQITGGTFECIVEQNVNHTDWLVLGGLTESYVFPIAAVNSININLDWVDQLRVLGRGTLLPGTLQLSISQGPSQVEITAIDAMSSSVSLGKTNSSLDGLEFVQDSFLGSSGLTITGSSGNNIVHLTRVQTTRLVVNLGAGAPKGTIQDLILTSVTATSNRLTAAGPNVHADLRLEGSKLGTADPGTPSGFEYIHGTALFDWLDWFDLLDLAPWEFA
jgi:hypothetical protein